MTAHVLALNCYTATVAFVAGVMDVKTRRIPNWFTLTSLAGALCLQGMLGGLHAVAMSALAGAIAGGLFLLFFLAGGMGGGDVKLIAAVAAGIGLSDTGALLTLTAICGGVLAVVVMVRHGRTQESARNLGHIMLHHYHNGLEPHPQLHVRNRSNLRLPYAVAIMAGTLLTISLQEAQR